MNKKIIFFIIAVIVICMISMYGCKTKSKNDDKEEKTLSLYIDVKDKQSLKILNYIIEDYKKENEDLKINMLMSSDTSDIEESSKNADIIFTSRSQIMNLSQKGILSDMKSYYDKFDITSRYYNIVSSYGRYNDKMYGIPMNLYTMEILYNKNMVKTSNGMPATIKEIESVLKDFTVNSKEVPVILNDGTDVNNILASFIACNSIKVSTYESIYRNGSESYKGLNDMQEIFSNTNYLKKSGILKKGTLESGNGNIILRFTKGEIPFVICSSNFLYEFKDMDDIKAVSDYSEIFQNNGIVPVFSNCILTIPLTSKNEEETEKFIKFAFSDDEEKKISERGFLTGNIKIDAQNKGLYGTAAWHMNNANENNIALCECLPEEIMTLISYKIDKIFEGKYKGTEWREVVDEAYSK